MEAAFRDESEHDVGGDRFRVRGDLEDRVWRDRLPRPAVFDSVATLEDHPAVSHDGDRDARHGGVSDGRGNERVEILRYLVGGTIDREGCFQWLGRPRRGTAEGEQG